MAPKFILQNCSSQRDDDQSGLNEDGQGPDDQETNDELQELVLAANSEVQKWNLADGYDDQNGQPAKNILKIVS